MSDGRRLRVRDQGSTKGAPRGLHKKVRSRLGSMCVSNEDSTDGDEDSVTSCGAKKSVGRKSVGGCVPTTKDNDKGLRSYRRKSNKVSTTSLAEKDVIDGFLILSFATYQDLESEVKANEDSFTVSESEILMEPQQSDVDSKDDDDVRQPADKLESVLAVGKQIINGHDKLIEETNKPSIPLEILPPVPEPAGDVIASSKDVPIITSQLAVAVVKVKPEMHQNIICDTAEEEKKVPPDLEPSQPETPKRDDTQTPSKPPSSPFPLKSPHFLPLQNGPVQQPEPSAAVAAVTVTASTANPATVPSSSQLGVSSNPQPLPSSTSPAGGVPFPSSLLSQEEFPVSPTVVSTSSKTVSPVLGSKSYDSNIVKPPRGTTSDVVHSLPYPICSSYSDYTVNYATSQYSNKHTYHNQDNRETNQRAHHQKLVANNNYYHHPHHQQPPLEKYPNSKESLSRSGSKVVLPCDGYKTESFIGNSYEAKSASTDLNYCVGQAYTNEKPCDPQYVYKKAPSNNVYSYKTNELLNTQNSGENVIKSTSDKPKVINDSYPNVNKAKVPNRTTYYQSIVNKTHSRHKSSRRVLPASAYENSKQVINNYSSSKPDLLNVQGGKPVQYNAPHYPAEVKKPDYYQPAITTAVTHTSSAFNYSNHKSDSQQPHISNSASHNSWADPSYTNSRNYKVTPEQCVSGYREKQASNTSAAYNTSSKPYSYYPTNKGYTADARTKPNVETPPYASSDYYQKGNVTYSKSGSSHGTASDVYKNSNHVADSAGYPSKSSSYQHSRTLGDKSRSYYSSQDNNYKTYHSETVPKHNTEDSHGYKSHVENSYPNYGSSSSLKSKEVAPKPLEAPKPQEQLPASIVEPTPSVHPVVCEASSYYSSSSSTKDKGAYYPHTDSSYFVHRRTPPPPTSKQQASFDSLKLPSKDPESFRISSTTAISSYSQRPPVSSSPVTVYDNSRSVVKTLWSPTATTPTVTNAPSREIITASSRDSHSSHSNSSISSLSQLSQSLGSGAAITSQPSSNKEYPREGGRSSSNGHSRCSSRDETPVCAAPTVTSTTTTAATTTTSSAAYGVSGSLTSLIFSKPSWTSPSVSSVPTHPSSHFTPPSSGRVASPVPSVLPLAPSLPSAHHSSPFSHHTPAAALHPAGPHVMFAPPLPTPGSLSSPSLPLATASGPFGDQDLLRRELDTRFLASQDRSINVPPPPYLRTELHQHQHQHTHMHQHSPFLPPPIGGSLLPPSAAHLYDKFPKVDSSFYGRNALGLPTYPSLSPLLAPGSATATPTPFAPPGHLAAFQPKISPLVKAKTVKSGRWCAMHVRISWEIYHHQQKQQAESQKSGSGSAKTVPDLLRPPNHLFGSLPRPHELSFSSPLLSSATSLHGRSPYDVTPQHPSFLGPTPAHLGMTPFARPNYPGLGVPGNSFGGLGSLGLTSAGMLAGRELGPGYLGLGQDPWSRLHRTPPNFPSPSAMNPSSWGGLKAEAERDRLQRREDQEREKEKEKMKKAEAEKREGEKSKELKEKREQEKQKERDRESRVSHLAESVRNGESSERSREREWERSRERRDSSRSPLRTTHKSSSSEGAFETNHSSHKQDIKVKEEKKEEGERGKEGGSPHHERTKSSEPAQDDYGRSMLPGLPMPGGLNASEQAARSLGVPPPHHFWNPLPPPPPPHQQQPQPQSAAERYLQHAREMDREQLMQKYASLSSPVMPLLPERYREAELARHLSSSEAAAREVERQLQDRGVYERTKLPPPPLRPNDPPYVPAPGLPPAAGGLFSSMSNPFLNTLCTATYPPRTKPGSPGGIGNGIPPPLIPCVSQGGSPVTSSTTPSPLHLKLGAPSNAESSRDHRSATEIESQSR